MLGRKALPNHGVSLRSVRREVRRDSEPLSHHFSDCAISLVCQPANYRRRTDLFALIAPRASRLTIESGGINWVQVPHQPAWAAITIHSETRMILQSLESGSNPLLNDQVHSPQYRYL